MALSMFSFRPTDLREERQDTAHSKSDGQKYYRTATQNVLCREEGEEAYPTGSEPGK